VRECTGLTRASRRCERVARTGGLIGVFNFFCLFQTLIWFFKPIVDFDPKADYRLAESVTFAFPRFWQLAMKKLSKRIQNLQNLRMTPSLQLLKSLPHDFVLLSSNRRGGHQQTESGASAMHAFLTL
jgi:hypothetical protein